ncbi:MAG: methylenetetrahydrofolate reductase [Gammaproteobacteria bacterium]|nr:methylenetetrahydrofolate reductase [Gammaproteobacteria bacterium]
MRRKENAKKGSPINRFLSQEVKQALAESMREAYMEIFPTGTIESRLDVLEQGSYVAVTCSPTKGIDETLDMSERLAERGFKVVPHVAAKMVKHKTHLKEILARLNDLPIISIFVPGGDALKAVGDYSSALELLRDLAEFDHNFSEIGIAAHPERHPVISNEVLLDQLIKKQEYSNYLVTQMCFDAEIIVNWIREIRGHGVTLPAWIGLPGVSQRGSLMKTSIRIGVGDSLRYLKNHGRIAAKLLMSKEYRPDDLLTNLAPYLADPYYNIEGHHIYCFNAVEKTEGWRKEFMDNI